MKECPPSQDVHVYENFLDIKDCETLLSECLLVGENEWSGVPEYLESFAPIGSPAHQAYLDWKNTWSNTGHPTKNLEIINKIKDKCSSIFGENLEIINEVYNLKKFSTGKSIGVHYDSITNVKIKYGIVYYLNDDYTGGEIYYPELNLEIKPKKNSLIVHPSNKNFAHGVKEVLSGNRYSLSFFVSAK